MAEYEISVGAELLPGLLTGQILCFQLPLPKKTPGST